MPFSKSDDPKTKLNFFSGNDYSLKCGCCASLGLPLVVTSKWESFKSIVNFNLSQRKLYGRMANSHIRVYTYVIDDPDQVSFVANTLYGHTVLLRKTVLLEK